MSGHGHDTKQGEASASGTAGPGVDAGGGGGVAGAASGTAGGGGAGGSGGPPAPIVITPRAPKSAPLRKLTTGLLSTYKLINLRYYEAKKARLIKGSVVEDYTAVAGDVLGKYKVGESMGKGSFGQVVSATDMTDGTKVAVKVIKNKEAFRRQARTEIRLLELLNRKDPDDQWCLVRFIEQFDHGGHTCLVFEHLSFNLYELLKRTHFRGVSLTLIRKFARQILKALAYLSLPEINVIHCDLKPENILFRVPNRSAIKVIDFGSSCTGDRKMYKYIQSRFYRSPEVILELPYSQPIDMWSLGCILVEMHTGVPLFAGRDEADQMRRFVALKGLPPAHMLRFSKKTEGFFEYINKSASAKAAAAAAIAALEAIAMGGASSTTVIPAAPTLPALPDGEGGQLHIRHHGHADRVWQRKRAAMAGGGMEVDASAVGAAVSVASVDAGDGAGGVAAGVGAQADADATSTCSSCKGRVPHANADLDGDSSWGSEGEGGGGGVADGDDPMVSAPISGTGGMRSTRSSAKRGSVAAGRATGAVTGAKAATGAGTYKLGPVFRLKPYLTGGVPGYPPPTAPPANVVTKQSSHRDPPVFTDLRDVIGVHTYGPSGRRKHEKTGHSVTSYIQFWDMLERMLEYDPAIRMRPMQALNHPFLREDLEAPPAGTEGGASGTAAGGGSDGPGAATGSG